jgi:hypothetical protein
LAQLGLAFRGSTLLERGQGGETAGIPESGFTDGLDGGCGRSDGLAGFRDAALDGDVTGAWVN